ncbi:MAG: hypothetical protein ACR2PZ_27375 [Pseudomonadales bacterium]
MPRIECLLWDFGDTLCDERFIWGSGPEWMEIYETFDDDGIGAAWSLGEIGLTEFASALSRRMNRSTESIIAHMTERCNHIHFFEKTYAFFQARHLPQAIVTVNPDLFSDVIVPICGFEADCKVIVTSWEERTIDKRVLNRIAMERLKINCGNDAALLIDNKKLNVDAWVDAGGVGYHYTDDETFNRDVSMGIDALARCS